jgi:hypothetical protein
MTTSKKTSKKTFDFLQAYFQLRGLQIDLEYAQQGDARKAALKTFCAAEQAFEEALKTLPKPRRCKHANRENGACMRCGVKFVPCIYGWGEVPEHKPNEAINEMVEELLR